MAQRLSTRGLSKWEFMIWMLLVLVALSILGALLATTLPDAQASVCTLPYDILAP